MSSVITRERAAPSATRTAISRRRATARTSNRLATLTHAISRIALTVATRMMNDVRTPATMSSRSGVTNARIVEFDLGNCFASASEIVVSSACAAASDAPGARRPTTLIS